MMVESPWGKQSLPTSSYFDHPIMKIIFTKHAELKFRDLEEQGFKIAKVQVEDALNKPENIIVSAKGRLIAQKAIDETHMIRVIYKKEEDSIRIITFYPTRRRKYGSQV